MSYPAVHMVMIHEAAHAVMARCSAYHRMTGALTLGEIHGSIDVTLNNEKVRQEGKRLTPHLLKDAQVARDACLIFVAGRMAEIIHGGNPEPESYAGDYDLARFALKRAGLNPFALLPVAEADCTRLLRGLWPLVVGLADHCAGKSSVEVEEVDTVLDRLFAALPKD